MGKIIKGKRGLEKTSYFFILGAIMLVVVAGIIGYMYGSISIKKAGVAEKCATEKLFATDPFKTNFYISQSFTGTLKSADERTATVNTNGRDVSITIRSGNSTSFFDCSGNTSTLFLKCKKGQATLQSLVGKEVKIEASISSSTYEETRESYTASRIIY